MKSKTILLIVAAALVLSLAGCDAILEGFYPEFANKEKTTYQMEVKFTLPGNDAYWLLHSNQDVYLDVYSVDTGFVEEVITNNERVIDRTFFDLPAGDYYVQIFWDQNGDAFPTTGVGGEPTYNVPNDPVRNITVGPNNPDGMYDPFVLIPEADWDNAPPP